jgi:hypothetical protein
LGQAGQLEQAALLLTLLDTWWQQDHYLVGMQDPLIVRLLAKLRATLPPEVLAAAWLS